MDRQSVSSGTPWEDRVGYARAVRIGAQIYVSGTTATDGAGQIVGPGDAYRQAAQCLENIRTALARLGAGLEHVVRTRIYVTDIERWDEIARAHHACFASVRPVTTMVEVRRLIDPAMLVEIEADAHVAPL